MSVNLFYLFLALNLLFTSKTLARLRLLQKGWRSPNLKEAVAHWGIDINNPNLTFRKKIFSEIKYLKIS